MTRSLLPLICLTALALTACGTATEDTAETGSPEERPIATAEVLPAQPTPDGPQIGDRIPQPRPNPDAEPEAESGDANASNRLAAAGAEVLDANARGYEEIGWEDLMPAGEEERLAALYQRQMMQLYSAPIEEGSAEDKAVQIGTFNTVGELNETKIRLPGYTVPFEFGSNAKISEFLLVPYFGACLHAPPPPPNQTIFVMTDEPIKLRDLAQAVWIEGTIYTQTQESELADAAYTIRVDQVEVYKY